MYTYGGKKTALSGPDATRRLESNSGAMNRAARKLRRQGYGGAAERMALAAAQTGLEERPESGPRWKSYETKMAEAAFTNQQQSQDNANAARLARVTDMEIAANEKRLQRYLNPSASSSAAGTPPVSLPTTPSTDSPNAGVVNLPAARSSVTTKLPATKPTVTPLSTVPSASSESKTSAVTTLPAPATSAAPVTPATPTLSPPKMSDADYRIKRESAIAAELGYGELTDAQKSVAAQGKIGGVKEGQFAYEDRQRLREQGIEKGYASPSEKAYVQSLKDNKSAEANARLKADEQATLKRIRDKVRKQVEGNPSLYGTAPYTPINPRLKP